jgi:RNA polymerase sigma factor for flagellar operon FliA
MQSLLKSYMQPRARANDPRSEAIRQYAPMVYRVVRQVAERMPPSVDREYLFSAGMAGLLDALLKYDASRGIAFEAYARIRVKGAILDELRGLDHLTRSLRRRSRSVQSSSQQLERTEGAPVSDSEVAEHMGVSIEEVQESRSRRAPPESLDPGALEGLELDALWQEPVSADERLEWQERVRILSKGLATLPERNRLVIGLYYEAELTLQEIGDVLGVTQSRVSQILKRSVELLREYVASQHS